MVESPWKYCLVRSEANRYQIAEITNNCGTYVICDICRVKCNSWFHMTHIICSETCYNITYEDERFEFRLPTLSLQRYEGNGNFTHVILIVTGLENNHACMLITLETYWNEFNANVVLRRRASHHIHIKSTGTHIFVISRLFATGNYIQTTFPFTSVCAECRTRTQRWCSDISSGTNINI